MEPLWNFLWRVGLCILDLFWVPRNNVFHNKDDDDDDDDDEKDDYDTTVMTKVVASFHNNALTVDVCKVVEK